MGFHIGYLSCLIKISVYQKLNLFHSSLVDKTSVSSNSLAQRRVALFDPALILSTNESLLAKWVTCLVT
jgi:hypothetical protein